MDKINNVLCSSIVFVIVLLNFSITQCSFPLNRRVYKSGYSYTLPIKLLINIQMST